MAQITWRQHARTTQITGRQHSRTTQIIWRPHAPTAQITWRQHFRTAQITWSRRRSRRRHKRRRRSRNTSRTRRRSSRRRRHSSRTVAQLPPVVPRGPPYRVFMFWLFLCCWLLVSHCFPWSPVVPRLVSLCVGCFFAVGSLSPAPPRGLPWSAVVSRGFTKRILV